MPGDFRDPEQSIPFHYSPKLDTVTGPDNLRADSLEKILQAIIGENLNMRLGPEKIQLLIEKLSDKGFLSRNPGDEAFRDEVIKQTKKIAMARRVALRCLI